MKRKRNKIFNDFYYTTCSKNRIPILGDLPKYIIFNLVKASENK